MPAGGGGGDGGGGGGGGGDAGGGLLPLLPPPEPHATNVAARSATCSNFSIAASECLVVLPIRLFNAGLSANRYGT